ncbi:MULTISPECIES: phosphoribosyl-AMP cyclohydrolase [unclassified Oceanobacter]|uniref:phosphoribosyl-AMP cyclohydrolase n=1 Tax=unclassified Oceanobacter TaxID=2620260 RepID=UPI00273615C7|nr:MULTISPECIES: phosphoribosyl-AMP cyclohydrolase [unclassified Oceanobacter]MDP2609244.1 phosphoribosyl-AMP cyclohydrolase [Oceanobacter sp. 1_MG-2023]MDP2612464.1 phosphoribosyl-AMP cyclohydrolase [Oceanobacter sp. 2_MG-2023]
MTSNPQDTSSTNQFAPRTSIEQVEESNQLAPKFDDQGLIACITTDAASGDVLMLGYMNAAALKLTIATGEAHYWSRSRQVLWHKGATSGLTQQVEEMRIDDDQDAVWIKVRVAGNGASCHVGYRSCFYRNIAVAQQSATSDSLTFNESDKVFDPEHIYPGIPNPTQL